mmetsp:Transcript_53124/g.137218  ORF Transcript_53124/g.137218 Transcript_53124/m.137218 type:complete len:208 (-) Transcript_53124:1139-1762(-)
MQLRPPITAWSMLVAATPSPQGGRQTPCTSQNHARNHPIAASPIAPPTLPWHVLVQALRQHRVRLREALAHFAARDGELDHRLAAARAGSARAEAAAARAGASATAAAVPPAAQRQQASLLQRLERVLHHRAGCQRHRLLQAAIELFVAVPHVRETHGLAPGAGERAEQHLLVQRQLRHGSQRVRLRLVHGCQPPQRLRRLLGRRRV